MPRLCADPRRHSSQPHIIRCSYPWVMQPATQHQTWCRSPSRTRQSRHRRGIFSSRPSPGRSAPYRVTVVSRPAHDAVVIFSPHAPHTATLTTPSTECPHQDQAGTRGPEPAHHAAEHPASGSPGGHPPADCTTRASTGAAPRTDRRSAATNGPNPTGSPPTSASRTTRTANRPGAQPAPPSAPSGASSRDQSPSSFRVCGLWSSRQHLLQASDLLFSVSIRDVMGEPMGAGGRFFPRLRGRATSPLACLRPPSPSALTW